MNLSYQVGIKRQVVQSLRKVYLSPSFPDSELATKINIELTYPIIQERYPAIYVSYTSKSVNDSGLGNYYYVTKLDGTTGVARQWFFEGTINFTILALDPIERDIISASIANMLAFGKDDPAYSKFRTYVTNEEFVSLQPRFSNLYGGTESENPAPWEHENEIVYKLTYSIETFGCFFTETESSNTNLIHIEDIRTYPYRSDQDIPQGSLTQTIVSDWDI